MLVHASICLLSLLGSVHDGATVVVVVGAAGRPEYGRRFEEWASRIEEAAKQGGANVMRLGPGGGDLPGADDRERLQSLLTAESKDSPHPVWLVLIGHGAYDRRKATFNLEGSDVSADDLAQWLASLERTVAVVNCASCSGPFINTLAAPGRVIVTATRSGSEQSFAHFGEYFSQAVGDAASDLDKDAQVSLLEAYLAASNRVEEFYKQEGRLATEHALLDDTGDGLGTPADWFRGVRATKAAKDGAEIDGLKAGQLHLVASAGEIALTPQQRARRDELEAALEALRLKKSEMDESQYFTELEKLHVELARIYAEHDPPPGTAPGP
jgi:hypothetical protein